MQLGFVLNHASRAGVGFFGADLSVLIALIKRMCDVLENGRLADSEDVPPFREFTLDQLRAATNGFSPDFTVSESGEKAPNHVFKGRLDQSHWIAVKKFPKAAWPDSKQFAVSTFYYLNSSNNQDRLKSCQSASIMDQVASGLCNLLSLALDRLSALDLFAED